MKRNCNLFSFFSRGVTATHPLCSVFILSFVFVFCSFSVSVRAAVSDIPEMSDWQFQQALDAYSGLTDDQKDIANFIAGAQGYAFAGMSQSNLDSDFSSWNDTINSAKSFGAKMWADFNNRTDNIVNSMIGQTNDLSNLLGNAASYAKTRSESFSAWLGNVGIDYNSTSTFRIQFGKNQAQNNIDYFGDKGLYYWQFGSTSINPSDFVFDWRTSTHTSSQYDTFLASMPLPHVRANNAYTGATDMYIAADFFSTYNILFADLNNNSCYLVDSEGNMAPGSFNGSLVQFTGNSVGKNANTSFSARQTSLNGFNTTYDLFLYFNNDSTNLIYSTLFAGNPPGSVCLSDFIIDLRVGYSFETSVQWTNDFNFNLTPTSQYTTVNSPNNVIYIDLNGFMHDLYDNPTFIYNYVIDNSVDTNGNPVSVDDFSPISKYITIPASGINIGLDFFKLPDGSSPLFDTYIADLWRNTKDLVLYCGDILKVFTLDDGGGLAYVVYGAIGVGVIGGIFSKFLL